jgi:hypothetical protein
MRRGIAAALLLGAVLVTASACTTPPPGTDGDLTNQWGAMVAPTGWEPKAGTCHNEIDDVSVRTTYTVLACTTSHRAETVHIGTFTGAAAGLTAPPKVGSPELAATWAECDAKAIEFLGGDWRGGHLGLRVSVPGGGNWEGGARWFICGLALSKFRAVPTEETGLQRSIKGEFAGDSKLKFSCYDVPEDLNTDGVLKPCAGPHNTQFAGTFVYTGTYAEMDADEESLHRKCRSVIAGYVGVPDNNDMSYRTGTYNIMPSEASFNAGDRSIRCFIWMNKKNLNKSVKGGGNSALPIN